MAKAPESRGASESRGRGGDREGAHVRRKDSKTGKDDKGKRPVVQARVEARSTVVFRRPGVEVRKISTVDLDARREVSSVYHVIFEGHLPIEFKGMGNAVERAKGGPPEKVVVPAPEAVAEAPSNGLDPLAEAAEDEAGAAASEAHPS